MSTVWFIIRAVAAGPAGPAAPFAAGAPPRTPLGELTAFPDPLAGGEALEGARYAPALCPSALRASRFGPSGLKLSPQTQKPNFAHGRWEICRTNQKTAATGLS